MRRIRKKERVPTLLGVWVRSFVHQLFASLWSMQSKQLAVGSQSITRQAEHMEPIPLETPNCFPEDMEHLVPLETTTRKLSVGELQPAEQPSYHQHKHGLGQWLLGTRPVTLQHVFKCRKPGIDFTKVSKPDQSP